MADISNYYSDTIITGTAEDDSIYNGGSNVTIEALAGNDSVSNDYEASNVSISAGEGDDNINNSSNLVEINTGDGDDSIVNSYSSSNVTINGGNGDDTVDNESSSNLITGGAGDDSIDNSGDSVTVESGSGDDYIFNNYGDNVSISTGAGNDSISNYGVNVTADGGDGDDYFYEYGYGTAYVYSGGNDTLAYFNDVGTLILGDVSIQSSIQAYYLGPITLNLSNGNSIVLNHYNPNTSSSEIHTVASVSEVEPINVVRNYDDDTVITGTSLRDSVYMEGADNATISTGLGKDSVTYLLFGLSAVINTEAGDDYISSGGVNVTVSGGDGNDTFLELGVGTAYVYGGGNDTLEYFGTVDTLVLADVNISSSISTSEGITLSLSNGNSILLSNYGSDSINTVSAVSDTKPFNVIINKNNDGYEDESATTTVTGTNARGCW